MLMIALLYVIAAERLVLSSSPPTAFTRLIRGYADRRQTPASGVLILELAMPPAAVNAEAEPPTTFCIGLFDQFCWRRPVRRFLHLRCRRCTR